MATRIKAFLIVLFLALIGSVLSWTISLYFSESEGCRLGIWIPGEATVLEVIGEQDCIVTPDYQVLYIGLGITLLITVFAVYKYYKKATFIPEHKKESIYANSNARKKMINKQRFTNLEILLFSLFAALLIGGGNYYFWSKRTEPMINDYIYEAYTLIQNFKDEKILKITTPDNSETYIPVWFEEKFTINAVVNGQKVSEVNAYTSKNNHDNVLFVLTDGQQVTLVGYDERTDQCLVESDPSTYGWLDCNWIDGLPEDMGSSYRLF